MVGLSLLNSNRSKTIVEDIIYSGRYLGSWHNWVTSLNPLVKYGSIFPKQRNKCTSSLIFIRNWHVHYKTTKPCLMFINLWKRCFCLQQCPPVMTFFSGVIYEKLKNSPHDLTHRKITECDQSVTEPTMEIK